MTCDLRLVYARVVGWRCRVTCVNAHAVNCSRLVRHSPALLLYHEDTLAPRIEFVKRLFPETPRLLSRAPLLITHDPETFLMPKIRQLEALLPGVDVLKVVRWVLISRGVCESDVMVLMISASPWSGSVEFGLTLTISYDVIAEGNLLSLGLIMLALQQRVDMSSGSFRLRYL